MVANPTNYPLFQRTALKPTNLPNNPTNLPTNPTNSGNNPTNPKTGRGSKKPHKHKKGRSRETPRSALNREKAQKYWSFWQKEKYPDSIRIRVLLWRRRRDLIHLAAMAVSGPRRKASARKAARLRKKRVCCIRPRRRRPAFPSLRSGSNPLPVTEKDPPPVAEDLFLAQKEGFELLLTCKMR